MAKRFLEKGVIFRTWRLHRQGVPVREIAKRCKASLDSIQEILSQKPPGWASILKKPVEMGETVSWKGEPAKVIGLDEEKGVVLVERGEERGTVPAQSLERVPSEEEIGEMRERIKESWDESEKRRRAPWAYEEEVLPSPVPFLGEEQKRCFH